ncbi:MAG: cellulose binding domain-containing protein [Ruminiclostridium sp.]
MPRKLISITLTFLILASMVIPVAAASSINCSFNGSKVTISWNLDDNMTVKIIRDGADYKAFTNTKSGSFSVVETSTGVHTYRANAINSSNGISATTNCSVTGTGKPTISLEFINNHGTATSNERIYNWVKIYNLGATTLDLNKMKIRYFYTVDGEPGAAKSDPNNGQEKIESSDGRINPNYIFNENNQIKDVLVKDSIKMKFTKMAVPVPKADYYCDTYFENSESPIYSAYSLRLQPAFHKKNLTNAESDGAAGKNYIRNYDLTNDYSFNNSENICVYYDDELIWGNEPFVKLNAPTNLTAELSAIKNVNLSWTASMGAQSYIVYRSESSGGIYNEIPTDTITTDTNFVDTTVPNPTGSTGKQYFYKVVAVYNKILSDYSDFDDVIIYPYDDSCEYWTLSNHIISNKNQTDFALGTYIPVAFKIVLKKDITNPTIYLENLLLNIDTTLGHQLEVKLVSEKDANMTKLLKATLKDSAEDLTESPLESAVSIIRTEQSNEQNNVQKLVVNGNSYEKGNIIYVEFVLKVSASSEVLEEERGIYKYYNKDYNLKFTMTGNPDGSPNPVTSNFCNLTVKIVKPDKLK